MSDRFEPESYEDFLCRGKTARECEEIRRRLAEDERRQEPDESSDAVTGAGDK